MCIGVVGLDCELDLGDLGAVWVEEFVVDLVVFGFEVVFLV